MIYMGWSIYIISFFNGLHYYRPKGRYIKCAFIGILIVFFALFNIALRVLCYYFVQRMMPITWIYQL